MWLMAVPILVIVIATFWSVTRNDFVNWDDRANFLDNPHYRGLGWTQLRWASTTFLLGVYQPIAWMLLEVQYSIFHLDPWGYHVVSILLHVVNSVVLYALTIALIGRAQPDLLERDPWKCFASAAAGTALFAVHPLRTEVVAWVSCQPYLPCALFYLLAIASYLRANPQDGVPNRRWFWSSYAFFIAALLSKAVAVSVPFVLAILDVYPLNRLSGGPRRWLGPSMRRVWLEKLLFAAASVVFMVVTARAKPHGPLLSAVQPEGLSTGLIHAVYSAGFYVARTVVPIRISAFYGFPTAVHWLDPSFLIHIAIAITVTAVVFVFRRTFPALTAAWLIYLVVLGPNMGLIENGGTGLAADRYTYVPLMGFFVVGSGALAWCWSRPEFERLVKVAAVPAALVAVAVLAALSQQQSRTWRSDEALWTQAIEAGGTDAPEVHNYLGVAFMDEGRLDEAKQQFVEAIRLFSRYVGAHNNLGVLLLQQGRLEEGAAEFREVLRSNPRNVVAHYYMGTIFLEQRQVERAIREFARALELDPDNTSAARNIRNVLLTSPPRDARLLDSAQAVLGDPTSKSAYARLADALKPYD